MNICTSTNGTKVATLTVSVCADDSKLPLMLIFKGTEKGLIVKKRNSQIFHLTENTIARKMHGWMRG